MKRLIGRQMCSLVSEVTLLVLLSALPMRAQTVDPGTYAGRLIYLAIDHFDEASGEPQGLFVPHLNTAEGDLVELVDPRGLLPLESSGEIYLVGTRAAERLTVDRVTRGQIRAIPPPPEGTLGAQATLVALFNFVDRPHEPFSISDVRESVSDAQTSAQAYILETSYGQTWLQPTFRDWLTLSEPRDSYDSIQKLLDGALEALDPLVDFHLYSRLVLIFGSKHPSFRFSGVGTVGKTRLTAPEDGVFEASVSWDFGISAGLITHEIGHNLGLWHSSSVSCIPTSLLDPEGPTPSCADGWSEYGDRDDLMGSNGLRHFSARGKSRLAWLEPRQAVLADASGEYLLDQIELASAGPKILLVPLGVDDEGNETYYWVEYRKGLGNFGGTRDGGDVVQVRTQRNYSWIDDAGSLRRSSNGVRFYGLANGGAIAGRVTRESDGSPVANVLVRVENDAEIIDSAQTDEAGSYAASGLPAGQFRLSTSNNLGLIDEYFRDASGAAGATPVEVRPEEVTPDIDFALREGGRISGRVSQESDGQPLEGVVVIVYDLDWRGIAGSRTDAEGEYSVERLESGHYYLRSGNSLGFVDEYYDGVLERDQAVSVSVANGSNTSGIDFELARGGSISGRVTGETGSPLANVSIGIYDLDWNVVKSAFTDDSGEYRASGLPSMNYYLRSFNSLGFVDEYYDDARDRGQASAVAVAVGADTSGIDLVLEIGGSISGSVTQDASGSPLEGVWVVVYDGDWSWVTSARTDVAGRYRTVAVPAGPSYLRTSNSLGYIDEYYDDVRERSRASPVTIEAEADTAGVDFALTKGAAASAAPSRSGPEKPLDLRGDESLWLGPLGRGVGELPDQEPFVDVDVGRPFHDPYRGLLVEVVEKLGEGAAAQARLRLTFSSIEIEPRETVHFGSADGSSAVRRTVTVTNRSESSRQLGAVEIKGRQSSSFSLFRDDCSSHGLAPGRSCEIDVDFAAMAGGHNLAAVAVPTDDPLRPVATVSLYGHSDVTSYTLTLSRNGNGTGRLTSSPGGIDCGLDCAGDFSEGTVVTLVASPDAGSTFSHWSGDPDCSDGRVTMLSDKTCVATFDDFDSCAGEDRLCLNNSRFKVEVDWRVSSGATGSAQPVPFGSDDSGLLWFFDPDNWEMLIKVLNGCGLNDRYWVFAAATTDVEYTLRVTDTETRAVKEYFNPLGNAAAAITDTGAFDSCSATTAVSSIDSFAVLGSSPAPLDQKEKGWPKAVTCASQPSNLCLNQNRFEVVVDWRVASGESGSAQAVPFGSDNSGLFWFFDPDNWEMLVKVLDGCGLNDHYWVFATATTDVEYTLRVRETETGATREYFNPLGNAAAAITDTSAFSTCR